MILTDEEKRALMQSVKDSHEEDLPLTKKEMVLAALGFPVEANPQTLNEYPAVTVSLVIFTSIVSLFITLTGSPLLELLAFIPAEPLRGGGITLLTCFFVHGGFLHLFSNMYALFIFGDNTEDVLGHRRYTALLIVSTFLGSLLSGIVNPHENIPHVGASGGIFGVMVFYLLAFPHAKFTYMFMFRFIRIPAIFVLAFYAAVQFFGVVEQMTGASHVDSLAHIGGGIGGFLFWLKYRSTLPKKRLEY